MPRPKKSEAPPVAKGDPSKIVEDAIKKISKEQNTQFIRLGDTKQEMRLVLPTDIFEIDHMIIGAGGFPRGRIIEVYGAACIADDTFINYRVVTPDGKPQNSKGGTIKHLYHRFNGIKVAGKGFYQRSSTVGSAFTCPSMREDGLIIQNRIKAVYKSGLKRCIQIQTTAGHTLVCTKEHKIFVGSQWIAAGELSVGDIVFQHNNTRQRPETQHRDRPDVYVKHHPIAGDKAVTDKVWPGGGTYFYKRVRKSRAAYEAHMNGLAYDEYIARLNSGDLDGMTFLPVDIHVHHKDENFLNDDPSNLELHDAVAHGLIHGPGFVERARYIVAEDAISSITDAGERETYDISMEAPNNNFIANRLVVHNSGGKGTLLSQLIANTQRLSPKGEIAYIDAEHSFDPTYAAKLGVDTDKLLLAQPDCGEEALQATIDIVTTGQVRLAVIDSVAALVPRAELEGSVSDAHMGQQARMLGQALRKMTAITSKTKTAVVFTNQLRQNLGISFGNPNTTPGGKALGFFASLRLSVTRLSQIKKGDVNIGNLTKIKGEKNKTAPPFREASLDLLFDLPQNSAPGFDKFASLANAAIQQGIWKQDGALYTLASTGEQVRGKDNVRDALCDDEKVRRITTEATLVALGKSAEYIARVMKGAV